MPTATLNVYTTGHYYSPAYALERPVRYGITHRGTQVYAGAFTAQSTYIATRVSLYIRQNAWSPVGPAYVYLYNADVNGKPTGAPLTTVSYDPTTLPVGYDWVDFDLSPTIVITAGNNYAVASYAPNCPSGHYVDMRGWAGGLLQLPNGNIAYSSNDGGSSWAEWDGGYTGTHGSMIPFMLYSVTTLKDSYEVINAGYHAEYDDGDMYMFRGSGVISQIKRRSFVMDTSPLPSHAVINSMTIYCVGRTINGSNELLYVGIYSQSDAAYSMGGYPVGATYETISRGFATNPWTGNPPGRLTRLSLVITSHYLACTIIPGTRVQLLNCMRRLTTSPEGWSG